MFKIIFQSFSNALQVFVGLWGLTMTEDLTILFVLICLAGVINLIIALKGHQDQKALDKDRIEDRQRFAALQAHVRQLIGPMDIPAHLQDLTRLSNLQLQGLVEIEAASLRQAGEKYTSQRSPMFASSGTTGEVIGSALMEAAADERQQMIIRNSEQRSDYLKHVYPSAFALWRELTSRLPAAAMPKHHSPALKHGMLVGPNPLEDAALELEQLGRLLPSGAGEGPAAGDGEQG